MRGVISRWNFHWFDVMDKNEEEFVLTRMAPCGLHCGRCFAFDGGDIHRLSRELRDALGNFDVYAQRFTEMLDEPAFNDYPAFKRFLGYLSNVSCQGCRREQCKLFKSCNVRVCTESRHVDFCYRCDRFPCSGTGFDEHLYRRYVEINCRIKELGIKRYYEDVKDKPRYG